MEVKDYMKLSKKRLAELLAERDARDALALGIGNPITIKPYEPPCYTTGGKCTNPFHDCINCPNKNSGGIWMDNIYDMGAAADIKREE